MYNLKICYPPFTNATSGPKEGTWSGVYCANRDYTESYSAFPVTETQYSQQVGGYFNIYKGNDGKYWFNEEIRYDISYGTRWYFDPIYTYYFYRDENKESTSYPSGNEISNIVEWVQYQYQE